LLKPLEKRME